MTPLIDVVAGARPNFMKIAPILRALDARRLGAVGRDVVSVPLRDNPVFATVIPSKIFESMGMGVPILMSLPEGEGTRIVRETGSGVCVPPEDPEAMAAAIAELADNPAKVAELRNVARAAAPRFSRDSLAERMVGILAEIGRR